MAKINWKYEPNNKALELANEYEIHPLFTTILMNRGFQEDEVIALINNDDTVVNDPTTVKYAVEAAKAIYDFIVLNPNGRIIVQADYDCDGITSGYVMGTTLAQYHDNVIVNYPERHEGYGLQMKFCEKVVETMDSPTLLITVDNGVAAVNEVQYLIDNGVQVIVTDHHKPKETVPNCLVVDPHCYEDDYNTHLCGVGVAYKVMQIFVNQFEDKFDTNRLLPAVAIGTVADMMPMTLENIYYIRNGIALINSEYCPVPFKAFKHYNGIDEITPTVIGWDLGPTINACGRMGNTKLAGNFIFSDNLSLDDIMDDYVAEMIEINEKRKELTKKHTLNGIKQIKENEFANVVILEECEEGLAGVVANKVIEVNNRPTAVLVKTKSGNLVGSARTPDGLSILDILNECKDTIMNYGGHAGAAGLTVSSKQIDAFKEAINNACSKIDMTAYIVEEDNTEIEMAIDYEITIQDLNKDTLSVVDLLPYDKNGFSNPIFSLKTMIDKVEPTQKNPNNAFITLKQGYLSKRFWVADIVPMLEGIDKSKEVELIGTLDKNFMNSKTTPVVLKIMGVRQ